MGEIYPITEIKSSMNLTELLISMALSSLIMGISVKAGFEINHRIQNKLKLTQERNEVFHALNTISRTIRQSGFPAASMKFPKLKGHESFAINEPIRVGKSSSLDTSRVGTFNFRKGINNVNESDALSIEHASQAQFNCLGQRITPKRLIKGNSYQGFFAQRIESAGLKTGMLICQTIDSNGHLQNDGILSGIAKLNFVLLPNPDKPEGLMVSLKMSSGIEYSRYVGLRNLGFRHLDTVN